MKAHPTTIYASLVSFLIGLIFGGILVGAPHEGFAAVLVGVVGLTVLYTVYLWRIGGRS